MTTAAVLVNYNGGDANLDAIESLRRQVDRIVVVDNASRDGSVEKIRSKFGDEVTVIQSDVNLGFGKACNLGAARVEATYLLFFNNDAVADPEMVHRLRRTLEDDNCVGIAGPVVYEYAERDVVQSTLPTIDRWGFPLEPLGGVRRGDPRLSGAVSGFYVPGCALFIRQDLFRQLRGFDEGMFMFVEDIDLCWRAQMMGYDVRLAPAAQCWHVGGGTAQMGVEGDAYYTSELRIRLREENTIRMMLVNLDGPALIRYVFLLMPVILGEAAVAAVLRKKTIARAYFEAFRNVLVTLGQIMSRRREVQGMRNRPQKALERVWSRSYGKFVTLRRLGIPQVKSFTRG